MLINGISLMNMMFGNLFNLKHNLTHTMSNKMSTALFSHRVLYKEGM